MLFPGSLGRSLFPVAYCRELSDELRVADLDGVCGDNSRLDTDEDQELHTHFVIRRADMGTAGLGFQLHTASSIPAARAFHAARPDRRRRAGNRLHQITDARVPAAYRARRASQFSWRDSLCFVGIWRHVGSRRLLDRAIHRPISRGMADPQIYQDAVISPGKSMWQVHW